MSRQIKAKGRVLASAFSLIELSIVIIVMGVLILGTMAGNNLIKVSKMTAIIKEYNSIRLLSNAFYLDYGRLPGDTNGDNRIDPNTVASGSSYKENIYLWRELLIDNSNTNAGVLLYKPSDSVNNNLIPGVTIPTTKYNPNVFGWNLSHRDNFRNNILTLASYDNDNNNLITQSIPAIAVQYVDNKIDDNKPLSGSIFSTLDGSSTECNPSHSSNEYDLNAKDAKCFLAFWNNPLTEGSIDSFTSIGGGGGDFGG
jgi:hypothetical protein